MGAQVACLTQNVWWLAGVQAWRLRPNAGGPRAGSGTTNCEAAALLQRKRRAVGMRTNPRCTSGGDAVCKGRWAVAHTTHGYLCRWGGHNALERQGWLRGATARAVVQRRPRRRRQGNKGNSSLAGCLEFEFKNWPTPLEITAGVGPLPTISASARHGRVLCPRRRQ